MKPILYGIPNCDTVRKARRWLDSRGVDYRFHDVRADGLNRQQIKAWIDELGLDTLINKRSTSWKALDASHGADLDEASAVSLILENPTLIKRPLLEHQGDYEIGFKPEQYARLFT